MAQEGTSTMSDWILDEEYNRYKRYDYNTQEWIWYQGNAQATTESERRTLQPYVDQTQAGQSSYSYGLSSPQSGYFAGQRSRQDTLVNSNSNLDPSWDVRSAFQQMTITPTGDAECETSASAPGGQQYDSSTSPNVETELVIRNKHFKRRYKSFFTPGTVFQCLYNQEAGPVPNQDDATHATKAKNAYGERVHAEVRMFVVMQDNEDFSSTCLSIQTYNGRGVSKRGLKKSNHSIVFSDSKPPKPMVGEYPSVGEAGMRTPIKIDIERQTDRLDPKSRINLRARHTCQQNWKVYKIGQISRDSWNTLWIDHYAAIEDTDDAYGHSAAPMRRRRTSGQDA